MIFVVTGVHEHGFNRLVKAVDDLAREKVIHDVVVQTGFSTYRPRHCRWRKAFDFGEFEICMEKADLIITHAGAGCVAGALERGKRTILVPRLKKYNEHNNDHQLELAAALEAQGRAIIVHDVSELGAAIERAWTFRPEARNARSNIPGLIRQFLEKTAARRGLRIGCA